MPKGGRGWKGGHYLEWALAGCLAIVMATLVVNALTTDRLVRALLVDVARIGKTVEALQQAGPPGTVVVPPANLPAPVVETAPQNVGVPGTRATFVIPGSWVVTPREGAVNVTVASTGLAVQASTVPISGDDLQKWFKDWLATFVKGETKAIVGPNQILVGGLLAMDVTLKTEVIDFDGGTKPAPVYERITAVRDGGSIVLFRARSQQGGLSALDAWDAVLASLTFQSQ